MKIKKFNENIEWLEGETIKLIDLTGPIKSKRPTHRHFVKIEFERGALCILQDRNLDIERYLDKEFFVIISDAVKYNFDMAMSCSQDPEIPQNYKFALLSNEYGEGKTTTYFSIFDLKGNLVFFTHAWLCSEISLFGDILTFNLGHFPTLINLKTHESHIRHK